MKQPPAPFRDGSAARRALFGLAAASALLVAAGSAAAQAVPPTQGAAVYRYAEPGQTVIAVDVWGAVGRPGRYQVVPQTDLLGLLSLAGGPALTPERDRVVRTVTVELARGGGERTLALEAPLAELARGGRALPPLEAGDLVNVRVAERERRPFTWRDAITVASGASALAVLVLRIAGG